MSFRCVISTIRYSKEQPRQLVEQVSPLRFETKKEAENFGNMMFEPPQTVEKWTVDTTTEPANYCYKKGILTRLNQQ